MLWNPERSKVVFFSNPGSLNCEFGRGQASNQWRKKSNLHSISPRILFPDVPPPLRSKIEEATRLQKKL